MTQGTIEVKGNSYEYQKIQLGTTLLIQIKENGKYITEVKACITDSEKDIDREIRKAIIRKR